MRKEDRGPFPAFETGPLDLADLHLAARPTLVVTRLRTRGWQIVVQDASPTAARDEFPARATLLLDASGRPLPEAPSIPPRTTFYVGAAYEAGDRFPLGEEFAAVHPALMDLGTWFGTPGCAASTWTPSAGPRAYGATFRFRLGRPEGGEQRIHQIMELAAQGQTDRQIALRLALSEHTVESYWRTLREKTGAANRTAAVTAFLETRHRHEQEDVQAERDRRAAEAWLAHRRSVGGAIVRSWPLADPTPGKTG